MLHVTDTETNFQVMTCELAIASYNSRSQVRSCDRKLQVALASYKSRSKVITRDRKLRHRELVTCDEKIDVSLMSHRTVRIRNIEFFEPQIIYVGLLDPVTNKNLEPHIR